MDLHQLLTTTSALAVKSSWCRDQDGDRRLLMQCLKTLRFFLRIVSSSNFNTEDRLSLARRGRSRAENKRYTNAITNVDEAVIVQELCESRGGRPGLSVLTSLLVPVDVKLY